MSPPGSGKSWFVKHLGSNAWVDVDEFLGGYLKFHTEDWHSKQRSELEIERHYKECDLYLEAMRRQGLWVVGSLFWEYVPDSIVILEESVHKIYVSKRNDLDWSSANKVRTFLKKHAKDNNVKVYNNWESVV